MMQKLTTLILLFVFVISGLTQEQHLGLEQIIDSARHKHPLLLNAQLVEKSASNQKNQWFQLPAAELKYTRGHLFGPSTDNALEIKQSFGNPFAMAAMKNSLTLEADFALAQQQLSSAMLIAEIKKAYFKLQYYIELDKLYGIQYQSFSSALNFSINADSSTIDEIDLLMLKSAFDEADMLSAQSYNSLIEAQNELLHVSFLENETLPADSVFEIYQITASTDNSTRTPARLFNNVSDLQYNLSLSELQLANAARFPDIYAEWGRQSFQGQKGFQYWSVGIAVPLWATLNNSERSKAKLQSLIARNQQTNKRSQADAQTANLLTQLNRLFERLNYFYDTALPHSQNLYELASEQFVSNTGTMQKKIWAMQKAFELRKQYLDCILEYNLKAAEIEVYAY